MKSCIFLVILALVFTGLTDYHGNDIFHRGKNFFKMQINLIKISHIGNIMKINNLDLKEENIKMINN